MDPNADFSQHRALRLWQQSTYSYIATDHNVSASLRLQQPHEPVCTRVPVSRRMCGSIFYNGSLTHIRFIIFDTSGASTSCVALLAFLIEVQPEYCFKKDLAKPRHGTLRDTYPLQLNITKSTKGEKEACNSICAVYSMIEARLEPPRRSLYHTACSSNGDELTASATISVECKVIVQAKMQAGELRDVSAWRVICFGRHNAQ